MKKNTKFRRSRKPRARRSSKGGRSPLGEIVSLREQLCETLIGEIRPAAAHPTARLAAQATLATHTKAGSAEKMRGSAPPGPPAHLTRSLAATHSPRRQTFRKFPRQTCRNSHRSQSGIDVPLLTCVRAYRG